MVQDAAPLLSFTWCTVLQCADRIFSEEIAGTDLTPRQYTVLAVIADEEGLSQTELVMRTGIDRSTVADMIKRLVIGRVRRNWPAVEIMVRGDSHFATPEVMDISPIEIIVPR